MAYKITKTQRVVEDLELCSESGEVVKTLHIDIALDPIIGEYNKRSEALKAAERGIKFTQRKGDTAGFEKAATEYGNAIINVFTILFGEDNTAQLLDFYENKYSEMLFAVYPFINAVIVPAITRAAEAKKAQTMAMFGGSTPKGIRRKK